VLRLRLPTESVRANRAQRAIADPKSSNRS
jgi:hypothetical protein